MDSTLNLLIYQLFIYSDKYFFRGVLPFPQRKRLWEKYRAKFRKQRGNQSELVSGAQVCMKNSPMYQSGALAFTVVAGVPKVGQLQNSAWTLSDSCTFKIMPLHTLPDKSKEVGAGSSTASSSKNPNKETADRIDMPPPPSPASSTCSDTGSITNSHSKCFLIIYCFLFLYVFTILKDCFYINFCKFFLLFS